MKHEPGHHHTVCTRRVSKAGTGTLTTHTLSSVGNLQSQLRCGVCLDKSYFLCAHQKGWSNPDGVSKKPCKSLGLRLQGMMEPGAALRAAETTAV